MEANECNRCGWLGKKPCRPPKIGRLAGGAGSLVRTGLRRPLPAPQGKYREFDNFPTSADAAMVQQRLTYNPLDGISLGYLTGKRVTQNRD